MKMDYLPGRGFRIGSFEIKWDEERESIRSKFQRAHKEDDRVIDLGTHNLVQKRDIYKDINGDNYFFCNYDEQHCFNEFEVHRGAEVVVNGVVLPFGQEISTLLEALARQGHRAIETEEGNFFFEDLKMVIATDYAMGGEGTGLSYFYAGKDVSHLMDEVGE